MHIGIEKHNPGVDQTISASAALAGRCVLCGGAENRVIFRKNGYLLRRCLGCSLVFVFPQPTDEQLAQTYSFDSGYFVDALRNDQQLRLHRSMARERVPFPSSGGCMPRSSRSWLGWDPLWALEMRC
jgi:hypothetical protein